MLKFLWSLNSVNLKQIFISMSTLCVYILRKCFEIRHIVLFLTWHILHLLIIKAVWMDTNYETRGSTLRHGETLWDTEAHNETWGPTMRHGNQLGGMQAHYRKFFGEKSRGYENKDDQTATTSHEHAKTSGSGRGTCVCGAGENFWEQWMVEIHDHILQYQSLNWTTWWC